MVVAGKELEKYMLALNFQALIKVSYLVLHGRQLGPKAILLTRHTEVFQR